MENHDSRSFRPGRMLVAAGAGASSQLGGLHPARPGNNLSLAAEVLTPRIDAQTLGLAKEVFLPRLSFWAGQSNENSASFSWINAAEKLRLTPGNTG